MVDSQVRARPTLIVAIRPHPREERRTNHFPDVASIGAPHVLDRDQVRRYLTSMRTTVSSKGQIVLPAEFRQMDGVKPGQEFDVERLDPGDYRLVRACGSAERGRHRLAAGLSAQGILRAHRL